VSNVTDINSRVDLDLDDVEAKLEHRPDYFFTRKGKLDGEAVTQRIRVTDPNKLDWRILVTLNENAELLGYIIPDSADKVFLRENPIPIEVLGILLGKLQEHFGLPEIGRRKQLPI
jgi:hypothetical protein